MGTGGTLPFDRRRAEALVMEMMAIPGRSGQEGNVARFITQALRKAGLQASAIRSDSAHRRSPLGGEVGNLIARIPGTVRAPRRMLMAHLDTVPICVGCRPVRRNGRVESADPSTGLGADDRAGAAAVLVAGLEILRHKIPHPPLTLFWPVQEEVGLFGARLATLGLLGRPALAFNFDGGAASKVTIGATGAYRLRFEITGRASHAGVRPEEGVSAIAIAALAIARLHEGGWHGRIEKPAGRGTSNVGVIQGGQATNIVCPSLTIDAEVRSHDAGFRRTLAGEFRQAFEFAAKSVRSSLGRAGQVQVTQRLDYESFVLDESAPCVQIAQAAVRAAGAEPKLAISDGGLDANWMYARGIPTVTLGAGQVDPHTTNESLDLAEFERACRVALYLACGSQV